MKKIILKEVETGLLSRWTVTDLLEEINRDRSEGWEPYIVEDWREGWDAWCEGETWVIINTA